MFFLIELFFLSLFPTCIPGLYIILMLYILCRFLKTWKPEVYNSKCDFKTKSISLFWSFSFFHFFFSLSFFLFLCYFIRRIWALYNLYKYESTLLIWVIMQRPLQESMSCYEAETDHFYMIDCFVSCFSENIAAKWHIHANVTFSQCFYCEGLSVSVT